jgi:hypothetical protein
MRPVTQVALVAVNRASTGLTFTDSADDAGSISKAAPVIINTRKLTSKVLVGFLPDAASVTEVMQILVATSIIR